MTYIDGFVLAVPTDRKSEFMDHAHAMDGLFIKYGALRIVEAWGDDVPEGKVTSFPLAVKCKPSETVVFSWVEWPSKAHREDAMPKIMEAMESLDDTIPYDGKRMIFGSFESVLDLKA